MADEEFFIRASRNAPGRVRRIVQDALAGTLGEGAHEVPGVDACLLTDATEGALRMIVLGSRLPPLAARGPHAEVSGTQRPSSVR